jgi:hypothetical protein
MFAPSSSARQRHLDLGLVRDRAEPVQDNAMFIGGSAAMLGCVDHIDNLVCPRSRAPCASALRTCAMRQLIHLTGFARPDPPHLYLGSGM